MAFWRAARHRRRQALGARVVALLVAAIFLLQLPATALWGPAAKFQQQDRHRQSFAAAPTKLLAGVRTDPSGAQPAKTPPVLDGVWKTDDTFVFTLNESTGGGSISSKVLHDECTGGPRSEFISGTLVNNTLNGTLTQCSPSDSPLVVNCSLPAVWTTPFNATVDNTFIDGESRGEWWTWNVSSNGTWENCTLDHYFNETFSADRLDCGLRSFAQLADQYITDPTQVAPEVELANEFEGGKTLVWTDAQSAPGGFRDQVSVFQAALRSYGVSSTVNSAYRPILYQAHFADMRICLLQMLDQVTSNPQDAAYLGDSVARVNQAVHHHGIKADVSNAAGLEFDVPFVCWRPPLTQCAHVNQRAVDITMQNPGSMDWLGALYGFCRPYIQSDPVHWEYISDSPWGSPKCAAAGVGPGNAKIHIVGNSPINLLVTSPSGERVGFDPGRNASVNDFGTDVARYSGPDSHPQVIEISENATELGNYTISGIGTGEGPYSITTSAINPDGETLDEQNVSGTAASGIELTPVKFSLRADYAPAPIWTVGERGGTSSGSTSYTVRTPNGSYGLGASVSDVSGLMYSAHPAAIALQPTGLGGPTTVTIPSSLIVAPFTVRSDGAPLTASTGASGDGTSISFTMPSNATAVTIEGTGVAGSSTSAPSTVPPLLLILLLIIVVAIVAMVAVWRLRRPPSFAPPPPSPAPPPPPLPPPPPPP
jgi:hypothetical protein